MEERWKTACQNAQLLSSVLKQWVNEAELNSYIFNILSIQITLNILGTDHSILNMPAVANAWMQGPCSLLSSCSEEFAAARNLMSYSKAVTKWVSKHISNPHWEICQKIVGKIKWINSMSRDSNGKILNIHFLGFTGLGI